MVARCHLKLTVANVVINIILVVSKINSSPRLGVLDRVCIATDVVQRIPISHPSYQLVEAEVCVCLCFAPNSRTGKERWYLLLVLS